LRDVFTAKVTTDDKKSLNGIPPVISDEFHISWKKFIYFERDNSIIAQMMQDNDLNSDGF